MEGEGEDKNVSHVPGCYLVDCVEKQKSTEMYHHPCVFSAEQEINFPLTFAVNYTLKTGQGLHAQIGMQCPLR